MLAAGVVVGLLVVEVFIRLWAAAVARPTDAPGPSKDHIAVLCVGDSHTWGQGLGYPKRLAERLAERSSRYRVINLGVPGTNTAQIRKRLPEQIERYDPELIVVWSGVNNSWNRTATDVRDGAGSGAQPSWQLSDYSRIARFVRVWQHNRTLRELYEERGAYVAPESEPSDEPGRATFERSLGDTSDQFVNTGGASLAGDALVAATRDDLVWVVENARGRGVPVVLIAYGLPGGPYGNATFGIRAAAKQTGAPLVEASAAAFDLVSRVEAGGGERPKLYDDTVHPTQALYEAVGDRVLGVVDAQALLPRTD